MSETIYPLTGASGLLGANSSTSAFFQTLNYAKATFKAVRQPHALECLIDR